MYLRLHCLIVSGSLETSLLILKVIWPLPVVFSSCVHYFKGYWLVNFLALSLLNSSKRSLIYSFSSLQFKHLSYILRIYTIDLSCVHGHSMCWSLQTVQPTHTVISLEPAMQHCRVESPLLVPRFHLRDSVREVQEISLNFSPVFCSS